MNAKVKCSNCGAEITNLTFSWGKKQWLWMLLAFVPMMCFLLWLDRPRGDFTRELSVSLLDTRISKDKIDVLGKINNAGRHVWESISVKAEFYGKDGRFLDEESSYISGSIRPGADEHFRITLKNPDEKLINESPKVILKVAGASNYQF